MDIFAIGAGVIVAAMGLGVWYVLTRPSLTRAQKAMYLLFWPGYLLIFFRYFFPNEWGRGRDVARTSRQFAYRNFFAGLYSAVIYSLLMYLAVALFASA